MTIITSLKGVTATNPNLPFKEHDSVIDRRGALWAVDLSNPLCWPSLAAPGAAPQLPPVQSLIVGGAPAAIQGGNSASILYSGGGFDLRNSGSRIDLGLHGMSNHSSLMIVWAYLGNSGGGLSGLSGILGSAASIDDSAQFSGNRFLFWNYVDGTGARFTFWNPATQDNDQFEMPLVPQGQNPGVTQIAAELDTTMGRIRGYRDGRLVYDQRTYAGIQGYRNFGQYDVGFGDWSGIPGHVPYKSKIYDSYGENLSLTGNIAQDIVRRDFRQRAGKYS